MRTPCSDPANNPDDWFIERDGKQYPDDDFLTHEEMHDIGQRVLAETGDGDGVFERVEAAIDEAEAEAKRAALIRRRHARDKCHVECYFRLQCLDLAIGGELLDITYGIRGGYYPEELKKIVDTREARRQRRSGAVD